MDNIEIREIDGVDVVRFQPQGVCSKLMEVKIQNDTILDANFVGGCSGNLSGIGRLVKGLKLNEVIERLKGIPCGSRPTSCPDQLSKCLLAYLQLKSVPAV